MKSFTRQWMPTIIAVGIIILILIGWAAMWYVIGAHNAREITTEQLTAQYEAEFQAYIDAQNYVSEDMEKLNRIDELTDALDELIAGYAMNSNINLEGKYAIGWCFIARLETGGFFGTTPKEVVSKPKQWQWYNSDNPVREEDRVIARAIVTAYVNRDYPYDYTADLVYADLRPDGSVILRNEYNTTSNTKTWKYKAV